MCTVPQSNGAKEAHSWGLGFSTMLSSRGLGVVYEEVLIVYMRYFPCTSHEWLDNHPCGKLLNVLLNLLMR